MRSIKLLLAVIFLSMLCGCSETNDSSQIPHSLPESKNSIEVNGRSYTVDEINAGIKEIFNNEMYLNDSIPWLGNILDKNVEYEMYFYPNTTPAPDFYESYGPNPKIRIVVTNILPSFPEEETQRFCTYEFGFLGDRLPSRWWGCQRIPYEYARLLNWEDEQSRNNETEIVPLGSYTMCINEIEEPNYQIMSDEWKENAKNSIRLYMDKYEYPEEGYYDLEPGNYYIYVQKFFWDSDPRIFFEHENGNIYEGTYEWAQDAAETRPACLTHVELSGHADDEDYKIYREKIKSDSAVSFEYAIKW